MGDPDAAQTLGDDAGPLVFPGRRGRPLACLFRLNDRRERFRHVTPAKGPTPGEHLEQHRAKRPDLGSSVCQFPHACSGDIYAAVPMITPIRVAAAVSVGD